MDNTLKTFPRKGKRCIHTTVKDRDLQINVPIIEDTHRNASFKNHSIAFSNYLSPKENEVKVAMAEAENAYDSMMKIRQQLKQAYEEFMHSEAAK